MGSIVNTVKYSAKVERPDGSSRNSFPSGHTANSFMNATFVHKEYGQYRHPLYSVAAYTMATATAVGRQLNNRHWISDVLAGAGIGILSTELGYLFADKLFKESGEHAPFRDSPFPVNKKPSFIELTAGTSVGAQGNVLLEIKEAYQDFFRTNELPYLRYKPEKAVCWSAGIGIQKRIGRNTALKLFGSFFDSDHDFDLDILTEIDDAGNYVYQSLGSEKVKFEHISFGLALTAFIW